MVRPFEVVVVVKPFDVWDELLLVVKLYGFTCQQFFGVCQFGGETLPTLSGVQQYFVSIRVCRFGCQSMHRLAYARHSMWVERHNATPTQLLSA